MLSLLQRADGPFVCLQWKTTRLDTKKWKIQWHCGNFPPKFIKKKKYLILLEKNVLILLMIIFRMLLLKLEKAREYFHCGVD